MSTGVASADDGRQRENRSKTVDKKPVYVQDITGARAFVGHATSTRGATRVARKHRKKACAALESGVGFVCFVNELN